MVGTAFAISVLFTLSPRGAFALDLNDVGAMGRTYVAHLDLHETEHEAMAREVDADSPQWSFITRKNGQLYLESSTESKRAAKVSDIDFEMQVSYTGKAPVDPIEASSFDSNQVTGTKNREWAEWLYGMIASYNMPDPAGNKQPLPGSYSEYISLLKENLDNLNTDAKLYYLTLLGDKLLSGANHSAGANATSMNDIFLNAIGGGSHGGICRDIHEFISQAASGLGFESVGTHSALWKRRSQPASGHVVSHYRDPATGLYYVQNYASVFSTGQKRLDKAIDVSTRILGPFTSTSIVQSESGTVHQYQGSLSRWIRRLIEAEAYSEDSGSKISVHMDNFEQTARFNFPKHFGNSETIRGFTSAASYNASDGDYRLLEAGVALNSSRTKKVDRSLVDQFGYCVSTYFGGLDLKVPESSPGEELDKSRTERSNLFVGVLIGGHARISDITGKLEFIININDLGTTTKSDRSRLFNQLTSSIGYRPGKGFIGLKAMRSTIFTHNSLTEQETVSPQTQYDKISVVIDSRPFSRKVYLINISEVYMFEGADKMSAIGIRNKLKAALEVGKLGRFYVLLDKSQIAQNTSADPFYEVPDSLRVELGWRKEVVKDLAMEARVGTTNGNSPHYYMDDLDQAVPEIGGEGIQCNYGVMLLQYRF
jgi:hypothetical protein